MSNEPTCSECLQCLSMETYTMQSLRRSHTIAPITYMNPAPPVTKTFFASGSGSNLVLPMSTGACCHNSASTYDFGLSTVEPLRP